MSAPSATTIPLPPEPITAAICPPPATDDIVTSVVEELNDLQVTGTLDVALRMGKLIVDRFYGGDLTAWRHHRAKEASFRKLAARTREDLRVGATCLYRAVALYELTCRIGTAASSSLTMTHLRAVLGLPEKDQIALLEAAEQRGWAAERLEQEAIRTRATLPQRRGRPAAAPLAKAVKSLVGACKQVEEALAQEDATFLLPDELASIYRAVDEIALRLQKAARALVGVRVSASKVPDEVRSVLDGPGTEERDRRIARPSAPLVRPHYDNPGGERRVRR